MHRPAIALLSFIIIAVAAYAQQKPGYDKGYFDSGVKYEDYSYGDKPKYDDAIHGGGFDFSDSYVVRPEISDGYFAPMPADPPTSGCGKPQCGT
jgi:outer membrane cobalamin receptor